jgi:hypothetical protein
MRRDRLVGRQKALGLPWGCEPRHAPFPLIARLVEMFRPVVQISLLPMCDIGPHLPFRSLTGPQLVGHYHPRHVRQALEQLMVELLLS